MRHCFGSYLNEVTGRPISGATVYVFTSAATVSDPTVSGSYETIYSDDGSTAIDQSTSPLTTDDSGFFEFWADVATVVLQFLVGGTAKKAISDVELDGSNAASGYVPGGSVTGGDLTMNTDRILGRTTASAGAIEELTVGTGLTLASGDLSASGIFGTADLTDPGADRIVFWDDSAGTTAFLTASTGLSISTTNLAIDQTFAPTWTGLHTFSAGGDFTPATTPSTTSVGYLGMPQNLGLDSGNVTTVMSDAGKHFYHSDANTRTLTIDSNANVAYPIGTTMGIIQGASAGTLTVAITSDTLVWGTSTGSRTIAAGGDASITKVASTTWKLAGSGVS